jgi:hypothetical protein
VRGSRWPAGAGGADEGCDVREGQVGVDRYLIRHGCLKTRTHYDEATAWSHHADSHAA